MTCCRMKKPSEPDDPLLAEAAEEATAALTRTRSESETGVDEI